MESIVAEIDELEATIRFAIGQSTKCSAAFVKSALQEGHSETNEPLACNQRSIC